ncbi:MAG: hypothetical protein HYZ13_11210 [Acidobacteria bacterium]|nr:hypothetical protein [Acidobacteriota bacterium]
MPVPLIPVLLGLLAAPQAPAPTPAVKGAAVFQEMSGLVGSWEGTFANGRRHTVTYRLTAGGTVLVETWALAPGRESMTLYHLDGEALVATHYCPQGNQPRLQGVVDGHLTRRSFAFRDGTNLRVPGGSHQHAFWVERQGPDKYLRSETYVANGSTAAEAAAEKPEAPVVYRRVANP